jgi:hypothetical protein
MEKRAGRKRVMWLCVTLVPRSDPSVLMRKTVIVEHVSGA